MNKKFKIGDWATTPYHTVYILDIRENSITGAEEYFILFDDGSGRWTPEGRIILRPSTRGFSPRTALLHGLKYKFLDNLTYIERLAKLNEYDRAVS